MATVYAGVITAALSGAFTVAAIIGAWLGMQPKPKRARAETWLLEQGIDSALRQALRPSLETLWQEGWKYGSHAAADLVGSQPSPFNVNDFMERWGRQWLNEIVQTRLDGLARIFADHSGDETELVHEVTSYLQDADNAHLIAVTEITRAINIAASETYSRSGVFEVRWQTEDSTACPQCKANQDAGVRQLGTPFPSGATAPPQHPRCRCALLPALREKEN